jgi:hypothetical protein
MKSVDVTFRSTWPILGWRSISIFFHLSFNHIDCLNTAWILIFSSTNFKCLSYSYFINLGIEFISNNLLVCSTSVATGGHYFGSSMESFITYVFGPKNKWRASPWNDIDNVKNFICNVSTLYQMYYNGIKYLTFLTRIYLFQRRGWRWTKKCKTVIVNLIFYNFYLICLI